MSETGQRPPANSTPAPNPTARRAAGNVVWLLVGEAVAKLASFAFVVIVARALTTTDYGYFSLALSLIPIFLVIGTWGLNDALFTELSRQRDRLSELFASGLPLRVGLGVTSLAVASVAGVVLIGNRGALLPFVLVGLALLCDELAGFIGNVFRAFEETKYRALTIIVNRAVTVLMVGLVALWSGTLLSISAMYLVGSLAALGFSWRALRTRFPPVDWAQRSRTAMRWLLRRGQPLALAAGLNMAVFRIDAVMVEAFDGVIAVAMYGIAYRFLDSFLFVGWSLGSVALPPMARAGASEQTFRTLELVLAAALVFYLPLAIGAPFAGRWVVTEVFGARYAPAASAVGWLLWAALVYALVYLVRMGCLALGRRRDLVVVAAVALVANVLGNLIMIPRYGFVGAAVMTVVTGLIEFFLLGRTFIQTVGLFRLKATLLVPALAGAVMFSVLALLGARDGRGLAVATLAYLGALILAASVFASGELRRARGLLRKPSTRVSG